MSKQHKTQQNKTIAWFSRYSLLMTLGQETRWAYSTSQPTRGLLYVHEVL